MTLAWELGADTRALSKQWILANLPRGSRLYLDWKRYCPEFRRHEFDVTHIKRAEILDLLTLESLRGADKDYLIISSLFYDRYFTDPDSPAAPRNVFRALFENLPVVKQFSPRYGTYGFHNPVITVFSLKPEDIARFEAAGRVQTSVDGEPVAPYWKRKKEWMALDLQYLWP